MSDADEPRLDACGCCETEPPETEIFNPPGQPELRYRIDTQPTFLQRMVNDLPHQVVPPGSLEDDARRPLNALTARALDDPSIALLDAWATVADVLTFYQERIANEGFLRTAVERRSVLELAREIGYELAPGVAASADLAFTVEDAVGAPPQAPVPLGTRVQSVPAPGETPQTFETIEAIVARPEWNAFPPRREDAEQVLPGMTDLFLAGVTTQLQVGDPILFVGGDRFIDSGSANWDIRIIKAVEPDPPNRRTRVTWDGGLNTSPVVTLRDSTGAGTTRVYTFRRRAQLFGHNAGEFFTLPLETKRAFLPDEDDASIASFRDWDDGRLQHYGFNLTGTPELELDAVSPKTVEGSWAALVPQAGPASQASVPDGTFSAFPPANLRPAPFPLALGEDVPTSPQTVGAFGTEGALFRVAGGPVIASAAGYALTATITRVGLDSAGTVLKFPDVTRRDSQFFIESEELPLGTRPVTIAVDGLETIPEIPVEPLPGPTGNLLTVGQSVHGLQSGQRLALVGKRPHLRVVDTNTLSTRTVQYMRSRGIDSQDPIPVVAQIESLMRPPGPPPVDPNIPGGLIADDPPGVREPLDGHTFELLEQLLDGPGIDGVTIYGTNFVIPTKVWRLRSRTGMVGTATLPFFAVDIVPVESASETVSEIRRIDAVFQGTGRMLLKLDAPLRNIYDRGSLTISANVASATHGESVRNEVLGNGDPAVANQTFTLKKPPLTYVPSPEDPSGGRSTLDVRVNGLLWREVPALFGQDPDAQVYTLRRTDDGQSDVIFGDGKNGSRLPSGTSNVVATYRTGIGLQGQVGAGSLTLLSTRPLGVRSVLNPVAAGGAAEPAKIEDARQNAPLTVRTLDRVVSVQDVQDFARAFAGIGKAQARLLWSGTAQLIHLTVGGADGEPIPADSPLLANLASAVQANGDPSLILQLPIDSFVEHTFSVTLALEIDERFETAKVQDEVRAALFDTFSFAERDFGQPVNESEILGVVQNVPGVVAASVTFLADDANDQDSDELIVEMAHFDDSVKRIVPGELLVINPDHVAFEELIA